MVFKCERSPFKARSTFRRRSNVLRDISSSFSVARKPKKDSNIKVAVRVRPPNRTEESGSGKEALKVMDSKVLVFDPKLAFTPSRIHGKECRDPTKRRCRDLKFAFDFVFDSDASNTDVYNDTTKPVLDKLLEGINCSVFAYGATGAGKTHTMVGKPDTPGVIVQTLVELFQRMEEMQEDVLCDVQISYLEIYNENVRDLFCPERGDLQVREDYSGVSVPNLSSHRPETSSKLLEMLAEGNLNRTQHPTDANKESSRSHGVFQLTLEQRPRSSGVAAEVLVSKMSLIDLAGSERATATRNCGDRFREGANINKSLLALGNCINALARGKKGSHIPYRNSKLTRILKDSLGGNCHTVMIAAVSPSQLSYDDTYNTLKYADRAKQIKADLKKNVFNVDYHVHEYAKIVKDLQSQNSELKQKLNETMEEKLKLAIELRSRDSIPSKSLDVDNGKLIECLERISEVIPATECRTYEAQFPELKRVFHVILDNMREIKNALPPEIRDRIHVPLAAEAPLVYSALHFDSSHSIEPVVCDHLDFGKPMVQNCDTPSRKPNTGLSPIAKTAEEELMSGFKPAVFIRPSPIPPFSPAGRISPIEEETMPEGDFRKSLSFLSPANISSVEPPWDLQISSPKPTQFSPRLAGKVPADFPIKEQKESANYVCPELLPRKPPTPSITRTPLSARQADNLPVIPSPSPILPPKGLNKTFRKSDQHKSFVSSSPVVSARKEDQDEGNATFTIENEPATPRLQPPVPSPVPIIPPRKVSPERPKETENFKKPLFLPPKPRGASGAASRMGIPSMSSLLGGTSRSFSRSKLLKSPSSSRIAVENRDPKLKMKKATSSSSLPQQRWMP